MKITGVLEICEERGVIYFHAAEGYTALRICRLPFPIPKPGALTRMLDISHMQGCDWTFQDKEKSAEPDSKD